MQSYPTSSPVGKGLLLLGGPESFCIIPGPTLLHAPNQLGLQDHCFGGFPSLLLQWQGAAFSGWSWESVVACPGKEHRVAEGTHPVWDGHREPSLVQWWKLVPEADDLHHRICVTCLYVHTCPLQTGQENGDLPSRKTKSSGFSTVSFLKMTRPLASPAIEAFVKSHGFLLSNKTEVCFTASSHSQVFPALLSHLFPQVMQHGCFSAMFLCT